MKRILTILAILSLIVGGAVGLPKLGANQGFSNPGSVEIGKDLTVGGSLTVGGVSIVNGVVSDDLTMDDDKDFSANAGTGGFNWSLATGDFSTSTGTVYLLGPVDAASTITAAGDGEFDGISVADLDGRLDIYDVDFPLNVTRIEDLEAAVGTIGDLDTTATDLVEAANELLVMIGNWALLDFSAGDLVDALNQTDGRLDDLETNVGDMPNVTTTAKNAADAIDELRGYIGDTAALDTTATDTVEAVNEVIGLIGDLGDLNNGEASIVEALNATDGRLDDLEGDVGTVANLETSATDLTAAVNELLGQIGVIADLDTTAADLVGAINETLDAVGDITTLTTNEQGSVVGAVNELVTDLGANVTRIEALEDASFPITFNYGAGTVDQHIFIADGAYVVTGIKMLPAVAGTDGSAVSVMLKLCDDTEAPSAGDNALTGTLDLKGTANTIQTGTLQGTPTLALGDSLGLDFDGVLTSAVGTITVYVARA